MSTVIHLWKKKKKRRRQTKPIHPSPLSLLVICLQFYVLFNLIRQPELLSQKNAHKEFHPHWLCDPFPLFTRHTGTPVVQIHFSVPKINADPQQTSRCTAAVHACVHGEEGNVFVSLCVQNLQLPVVGFRVGAPSTSIQGKIVQFLSVRRWTVGECVSRVWNTCFKAPVCKIWLDLVVGA